MTIVKPTEVSSTELSSLESIIDVELPSGALKTFLTNVSTDLRRGATIVSAADDDIYTPSEAAHVLGLSRTHLYKVLDAGALKYHSVGSHKRILAGDLFEYRNRMFEAQRQTAIAFSGGTLADDLAIDEFE